MITAIEQEVDRQSQPGYCDEDGECICSERPIDIEDRIAELLGGLSVEEWIKEKVRYFREQVEGLNISEEIKKAIPSRCQISDKYVKLCHTDLYRDALKGGSQVV